MHRFFMACTDAMHNWKKSNREETNVGFNKNAANKNTAFLLEESDQAKRTDAPWARDFSILT